MFYQDQYLGVSETESMVYQDQPTEDNPKWQKSGAKKKQRQWSLRDLAIGLPIGEGQYGNVHAASDYKSDGIVAVKIILKQQIEEGRLQDQLRREIEIQTSLNHPNILRLYGWFHDNKRVFLVLEYAEKGDLYMKLMMEKGHLSEKQAATYIFSLTTALAYCHERNIVHKDVKLENLLLDHEGRLKLADFGCSEQSRSKIYNCCGTLCYLAPELVEKKAHDYAVDNWSVGILCYELLYGVTPFQTETEADTFKRILEVDLTFPSTPSVSLEARHLISQLLVKTLRKGFPFRR